MVNRINYGMVGGKLGAFIGDVHRKAIAFDPRAVLAALKKHSAVLVYDKNGGAGALCRADSTGDCEALKLLVEKACVGFLHTRALGVSAKLSALHAMLMHMVYKTKYAKQIGG